MTSLLPRDHGVVSWLDQFAPDQRTLATELQRAGFTTEAVVAQSAFVPEINAFELGFDRFVLSWWPTEAPEDYIDPETIETSTVLTDRALEALDRLTETGEPFFLWVHYFDPHLQYLTHEGLTIGDNAPARYAGEVAWMDQQFGRLLDRIESDPELIVAMVIDHGEALTDHGGGTHGHTLYEELIWVALSIRAPSLPPGIDETPVGTIDLAPTLMQLARQPIPDGFDGLSLLPEPSARPLLSEIDLYKTKRSIVRWPHKLVWTLPEGTSELYHLEADPSELQNLWDSQRALGEDLREQLAETYPEVGTTDP